MGAEVVARRGSNGTDSHAELAIVLDRDEAIELSKLADERFKLQIAHSSLCMTIERAKREERELVDRIEQVHNMTYARLRVVAAARGIDFDEGEWEYDTQARTLRRKEQA